MRRAGPAFLEIEMFISQALAQTVAPAAGDAAGAPPLTAILQQFGFLIPMFAIMYFLLIRPQQKRAKQHQAMIAAVRRGDTVVTSGGIIGKVAKVEDAMVTVEIADGVKINVIRSSLSEVRSKGEPVREGDDKDKQAGA